MARDSSAERKRRYRQRQRDSIAVYPTPVPSEVIETAINIGLLSERDSHDRSKVGDLLGQILVEWHKR